MKAYIQTTCLLGFAAFSMVSGQSGLGLASLPDCAKPCANNLPTDCKQADIKCICGSSVWISNISCCVLKACSAEEQQKTIDIASQLCSIEGITLPTVATCPSSSTALSTTAAPASARSTTPESTSSPASAASKKSSSSSVTAGQNSATTTTGSSTSPTALDRSNSSPSAVSTGVAGHLVGQGIGAAGAAALALALI